MSLEAEQEQTTSGSSKSLAKQGKMLPMDLLDEYWFFNNTLNARTVTPKPTPKPPFLPKSPSPIKAKDLMATGQDPVPSTTTRTLLRTPSLPPIRVRREQTKEEEEEEEEEDRIPARPLLRAPSMPMPSHPSSSRNRTPRDMRRYGSHQRYITNEGDYYYWKSFQEKKWKSLSDLESMEVQGFKDLGFVFDKEEGLNESLANVIPGLRGRRVNGDDGDDDDGNADNNNNNNVVRPYLSEAWFVQRSATPMLKLVDRKSGVDMKDQLKFWARAVACNVRQEC